jgi:hypothetical protein
LASLPDGGCGRYKTHPNSVVRQNPSTGQEAFVLETSLPGPVTEAAMRDLISWYNDALPEHAWTVAVTVESFLLRGPKIPCPSGPDLPRKVTSR